MSLPLCGPTITGEAMSTVSLSLGKDGVVHEDARRTITEATLGLPDGSVLRVGTITVKDGTNTLGNHYHPDTETFLIRAGSARLYTASADTPDDVSSQDLVAGDTVVIPARVIHTFVCGPGTVLESIATQPFTEDWIVRHSLTLPEA